jgi:hypothetical protein
MAMPEFHDAIIAGIIGLFGAVGVATISGLISITGLVISKEQKLSDFRQAWIDALRDDISRFISQPLMISAYNELVFRPRAKELREKLAQTDGTQEERAAIEQDIAQAASAFYAEMRENYSKINIYSTRIKLRLNDGPHEVDSRALLSVLKRIEGLFSNIHTLEDQPVQDAVAEIETISRPLLKKEWERVKKGERTFQVAKYASLAVSCLLAVVILGLLLSIPSFLAGYATSQVNLGQTHGSDASTERGSSPQNCPSTALPLPAK